MLSCADPLLVNLLFRQADKVSVLQLEELVVGIGIEGEVLVAVQRQFYRLTVGQLYGLLCTRLGGYGLYCQCHRQHDSH